MPKPAKPQPKRANNSGSVTNRGENRWEIRVSLPDSQRVSRYVQGNKYDAERALRTLLVDLDSGKLVASPNRTVGEYLAAWLRDVVTPGVRPSTARRYEQFVRLHLAPHVGAVKLDKLAPAHLVKLYATLAQALAPRTIGHVHLCLHSALETAVRWELLTRNVCDLVDPPRARKPEIAFLSPDQARKVLAAARGDPLEALYALALTTGMRKGEILGLKWADVDLAAATLQIRRAITWEKGRGLIESEPKSAAAHRTVALTDLAVDALRRHHTSQKRARLFAGPRWEERGLVFPNGEGRPLHPENLLRRSFAPLLERAGVPRVRFHDLRHSAASLLLALGTHPKIVSEMLGHSSISLTLGTYSHTAPTLQRDAVAKLGDLLAGS